MNAAKFGEYKTTVLDDSEAMIWMFDRLIPVVIAPDTPNPACPLTDNGAESVTDIILIPFRVTSNDDPTLSIVMSYVPAGNAVEYVCNEVGVPALILNNLKSLLDDE